MSDYPGGIDYPAHESNYYQSPNTPKGWVLHTPEEPADNVPSTPAWFAQPDKEASTHYFVAFTGTVYQCVPERFMAIANGVIGRPYPSWADSGHSLNRQSLSVEIEGYAASIGHTLATGGRQWNALVALLKHRAAAHHIPLDREHVIGHYQVANNRTDPGAGFPWDALMKALTEEDDLSAEQFDQVMESIEEVKTAMRVLNDQRVKEIAQLTRDIQGVAGLANSVRVRVDALEK